MITALTVLLWLLVVILAGSVLLTVWLLFRWWRLCVKDRDVASVGTRHVERGTK